MLLCINHNHVVSVYIPAVLLVYLEKFLFSFQLLADQQPIGLVNEIGANTVPAPLPFVSAFD